MILFFLKIKKEFSSEKYEKIIKDRMTSISRDFNFQTDQAVTILEDKIEEMKKIISDADKRFLALSKQINTNAIQTEKLNKSDVNQNNFTPIDSNEPKTTQINNSLSYASYKEMPNNDKITKMKIVEMYKSGWSLDFIADKLSMSIEEVRLIVFMSGVQ